MKIELMGAIVPDDELEAYQWYGLRAVSPGQVRGLLEKAPQEPAVVYIDSGGGDVMAGSSIYAALLEHPGGVRIVVTGLAASAASVAAMAGTCVMAPTAMMMIHNCRSRREGDRNDLQKGAEVLAQVDRAISAAYQRKTGKTEAELLDWMNRETWMTAKDAVDAGFADGILGDGAALAASAESGLLPKSVVEKARAEMARAGKQREQARKRLEQMKGAGSR